MERFHRVATLDFLNSTKASPEGTAQHLRLRTTGSLANKKALSLGFCASATFWSLDMYGYRTRSSHLSVRPLHRFGVAQRKLRNSG